MNWILQKRIALTEGVMSYRIPQGDQRGARLRFYDFTHDGTLKDGFLDKGLGQLIDGQEGQSNFKLDPKRTGHMG